MFVRSKCFSPFVEKTEKLKLSLSKQRNKMLKIRSEMLKIRKKWQNNQAQENYPGKFRGNFPNSGNLEDFWDPENLSFPGKLKIREKRKPSLV